MAPSPLKCFIRTRYLDREFRRFMMAANVNINRVNEEGMTKEDLAALALLDGMVS